MPNLAVQLTQLYCLPYIFFVSDAPTIKPQIIIIIIIIIIITFYVFSILGIVKISRVIKLQKH